MIPVPSLTELLGIELPIIQAPMAGVQGSALAVAVSNAGGLGSLPCAMLSLESIRSELKSITSATARPFNVNFFCHTPPAPDPEREAAWRHTLRPYYDELGIDFDAAPAGGDRAPFSPEAVDILSEIQPPVVSFHFGLPAPELLQRVRAWGATIVSSATTVDEARWLEAHGADAIIAQGLEAGGHRGHFLSDELTAQAGTFALLPQIVKAVRVPVIAAGGIADAAGVAAAIALGAAAVQIGTAYLLCPGVPAYSAHQRLHGPACAQHRESDRPRTRADESGRPSVPEGDAGVPAAAREGRGGRQRRFLAPLVGPERDRVQGDPRGRPDATADQPRPTLNGCATTDAATRRSRGSRRRCQC
jgi:nitronate monooxygenase